MGLAWRLAGAGACHPTSLFGRLGLAVPCRAELCVLCSLCLHFLTERMTSELALYHPFHPTYTSATSHCASLYASNRSKSKVGPSDMVQCHFCQRLGGWRILMFTLYFLPSICQTLIISIHNRDPNSRLQYPMLSLSCTRQGPPNKAPDAKTDQSELTRLGNKIKPASHTTQLH